MIATVRGLYAIVDMTLLTPADLLESAAAAIRGGAAVIQYRAKTTGNAERRRQAAELLALCRALGVPLIINDDLALACELGADGVHVGRDDAPVCAVRRALGPDRIVGASCYNELPRALQAERDGADYAAFGSFFASPTKPDAVRAELPLLRRARAELGIPVVAIGGISPDTAARLAREGAAAVAVASGIFARPDPEGAAREYARAFLQGARPDAVHPDNQVRKEP